MQCHVQKAGKSSLHSVAQSCYTPANANARAMSCIQMMQCLFDFFFALNALTLSDQFIYILLIARVV